MTAVLAKTGVSPNVVTLLGLVCGVAAGWVMSRGTYGSLIAGAALLHLSFLLDNCDGELARLTGRSSAFGQKLDMTCDVLVDFALWVGLGFASASHMSHGAWIWVGAVATAGSLVNFSMVVYERRHGLSTSIHIRKEIDPKKRDSTFHSLIETLCHNGDVIFLVWIFALIGHPTAFLIAGSIYIHLIWILRSSEYFAKQSQLALQVVFTLLGIYLLYLACRGIVWADLGGYLRRAGFGVILAFMVYPLVTYFHTRGLYYLLPRETRKNLSFGRVYWASFLGEAVNKVTPFVDIGGEPIKIATLAQTGAIRALDATRAVWKSHVVFVVSEAVYLVPAVLLLVWQFPSDRFAWMGWTAIAFSVVYAGILYFIRGKAVGGSGASGWSAAADLAASFAWHTAGWVVFTLEVYAILTLIGVPVTWTQAFLIQAFQQVFTTVSFFIPASIGAQEGGLALLLRHLGFASESGIALSLLKRARQVFWVAAAFGIHALMPRRNPGGQ